MPEEPIPAGKPKKHKLLGLLTVGVGRRGLLCAVKPWHVLVGSYALFSAVWVLNAQKPWAFAVTRAAGLTYVAVAVVLFVLPVGQIVLLGYRGAEDQAPFGRRLLRLAAAWALVGLLMVPLLVIITGSDALRPSPGPVTRLSHIASFALRSRVQLGLFLAIPFRETGALLYGAPQLESIVLRVLNDLSILSFVVAVAYWVGRKCKSTPLAMFLAYGISVLALATVLSQDVVGALTSMITFELLPESEPDFGGLMESIESGFERDLRIVRMVTSTATCGLMLVRFGLAALLAGGLLRSSVAQEEN